MWPDLPGTFPVSALEVVPSPGQCFRARQTGVFGDPTTLGLCFRFPRRHQLGLSEAISAVASVVLTWWPPLLLTPEKHFLLQGWGKLQKQPVHVYVLEAILSKRLEMRFKKTQRKIHLKTA